MRLHQPLTVLRQLKVIPLYAHFSPNGRQLVVVDESDVAHVWDAQTGAIQTKVMTHCPNCIIQDAQFSPDGRQLLTSAEDRRLRKWDPANGEPIGQAWLLPRTAQRFRYRSDGEQVATASHDGIVRILDAETGMIVFELPHPASVQSVEWSGDGTRLVTACADGTARIWDATTGQPMGPPLQHDAAVVWAEFDRSMQCVATASQDKTVRVWWVATGQMRMPPLMHGDILNSNQAVRFSPDGTRIATSAGNAVQVWNATTGHPVTRPLRHGGMVRSIEFSPDGHKLLTASEDGMARLWDPESGHLVSDPLHHGGRVTSAEFSPDGQWVVTCSADMAVRIWEVSSAPLPIPEWLPSLAEAVAALRVDDQDASDAVPVEALWQLRQSLENCNGSSYYDRWARWFFADGAGRAISPLSPTTMAQYVERRLENNTRESLREATLLNTTNALAFARLADNLSQAQKSGPHRAPAMPKDAEWFSRYATNLAPNNPEILNLRKVVLERVSP